MEKKVHLPTNRCLFGELVFMDLLCVFSSFVDLFSWLSFFFFFSKGPSNIKNHQHEVPEVHLDMASATCTIF